MNILTSILYNKRGSGKYYEKMTRLCIDSFKENLQGDWEYRQVKSRRSVDNIFFDNFNQLHEWWKEGHNVFYINVDMLCVKPIEIFGEYKELTMFWQTDPRTFREFPVYFNCAVMYIPKETKNEIWEHGFSEYEKYFDGEPERWAADQIIYNKMLYKQGLPPEHYLDNKLHYLAHEDAKQLNDIPEEEARIVHFFATRGAEKSLEAMRAWRRN